MLGGRGGAASRGTPSEARRPGLQRATLRCLWDQGDLGRRLEKAALKESLSMQTKRGWYGEPYIELKALHILEVQGDRVLPRLGLVDVAYSMRCQIHLAVLVVRELEFSWEGKMSACRVSSLESRVSRLFSHAAHSPLIQPHIVLDKEQVLIGQIRGPQGGGQVDVL